MKVAALRPVASLARSAIEGPVALIARLRRASTPERLKAYDRLHLGSGARILPGWANVDITGLRTIPWDLRDPLPLRPAQVRFVYSEHFIEHIDRSSAKRLLAHVRTHMVPGGAVRLSTPDLAKMVADYQAGHLVRMDHGSWYPETPCRMLNEGMRLWGHTFLYDQPELTRLLEECGFTEIRRVNRSESAFAELRDLESRPDFGDLILEALA